MIKIMYIIYNILQKKIFTSFYVFLLFFASYFQSYSARAVNNINIDSICQQSSTSCLKHIDKRLNSTKLHSRLWFKYKLLEIKAIYILQKYKRLTANINEWLDSPIPPIIFQVYIDIYHGKILLSKNSNDVQAKIYIHKSLDLLSKINESIPEPLRFVELSNLLIASGQFTEAKQVLLKLKSKFLKRKDPQFLLNLYANFADIAYLLHKPEEHIFYRKKSLYWAKQYNNNQQIGITYFNLARSQQIAKNYVGAVRNFKNALYFAKQSHDISTLWNIKFRYVEVIAQQGKFKQATKYFKANFSDPIPKTMVKSYINNVEALKKQLEKNH